MSTYVSMRCRNVNLKYVMVVSSSIYKFIVSTGIYKLFII